MKTGLSGLILPQEWDLDRTVRAARENGYEALELVVRESGYVSLESTAGELRDVGAQVRDGRADAYRRAAGGAGDADDAAHRLNDRIVRGPFRVGAGVPESGERGVDQAGVEVLYGSVVQAEAFHGAGAEVFEQDV